MKNVRTTDVLLIHPSKTVVGGIVNATLFYAVALTACGHRPEIWTASDGLARKARAAGIAVFQHSAITGATAALGHPVLIARAISLRRSLKAVVHQGGKLWAFGRLWFGAVPEYVVFHNEKVGGRRRYKNWLALSEAHWNELETLASTQSWKRNVRLIRNGPLPRAAGTPSPRGAVPGRTLGTLGNFETKKDVVLLIRAFNDVCNRGHDLFLVLAGDGPEKQACERLVNDLGIAGRVSWPGWLDDTRAFFSSIDFFCLPSMNEPFGIVVLEAMQAGLPVVSTDTFGPRDIVVPGETGWLVPIGDVPAMAEAIAQAMAHPARARAFGAAGYQRFLSLYAPEPAGRLLASALDLDPIERRPVLS